MSDDKMRMTKTRLPPEMRSTIDRLTKNFDQKSKNSINERANDTFIKIERADGLDQKK